MYKLCHTEKSVARQRELEEGFLQYMNDVSYFEIEISALCRYLKIPRKTFYRYFGSKEDALYALVDHRFADLNRYIQNHQKSNTTNYHENAILYFTFWKKQKDFLDTLVRNNLISTLVLRAVLPENMPSEYLYTPVTKKDSVQSYIFNFWTTGMLAMMLQWYSTDYSKEVSELADITMQLLTNNRKLTK